MWKDKLEEMIHAGSIKTDSDIMDFAEEYNMPYAQISTYLTEKQMKGTECEACKHAEMYPATFPCVCCRRCKKDYYERQEK